MLKNQYSLVQTGICTSPGNFSIFEGFPQVSEMSTIIGNNIQQTHGANMINSGQFKEGKSCKMFNCCSCRAIKDLTLTMYGQIISKAYIESCCNLLPCLISQELIVTTMSEVLIGKVIKQSCFSKNIFTIHDSNDNIKYFIRKRECYCSAYFPRIFRCGNDIVYQILDDKQQRVGTISNKIDGCFKALFTYLDNYQINFPEKSTDKERILLMNALVYLDVVKHQFM